MFTVQCGALYGLQWCAVCAVQSAMVCAAIPLHNPNFCGGHYYIVNVHCHRSLALIFLGCFLLMQLECCDITPQWSANPQ